MNYSKQYISGFGAKTGFIGSNIEKVIRLLDVLRFIGSELDPEHKKLALKGGTAINLLYMGLPRLSVDIDLDYIESLDKEKAIRDIRMLRILGMSVILLVIYQWILRCQMLNIKPLLENLWMKSLGSRHSPINWQATD